MQSRSAIALVLLAAATAGAARSTSVDGWNVPCRKGVVLVGFQAGVSALQRRALATHVGAAGLQRVGRRVHALRIRPERMPATIAALRTRAEVRFAEPDYVQTLSGVPNDPAFSTEWAFANTGQTVGGVKGAAGADVRAVGAWDVTTGSRSVVIGVLDTGINYAHPDLAANVWSNPGGVNGCAKGTHGFNVLKGSCDPLDDDTVYAGHGTHVAGIIGAATNNRTGVAGLDWQASLMAIKWVSGGGTGFTSDLIKAIEWVVRAKQAGVNVRVVNDSPTWAGTPASQALADALDDLATNDVLFVAAAGNTAQNNDTTPRYPCSYRKPNEICVAASDSLDRLWKSSNFGVASVDLAAPGVSIWSTLKKSGSYGFISGTSMAAAEVTGAAALVFALGTPSASDVKATLLATVDQRAAFAGVTGTGGRLDVCQAVGGCASVPPVNTVVPVVAGTAQQGGTLATTNGAWSGNPTTFTYRWLRCAPSGLACSTIPNATAATYVLGPADVGATVRSAITASGAGGSATAISANTAVVQGSPLAIATTSLPDGTVGSAYGATLVASGGTPPYTWAIAAGALPTGCALDPVSGAITGAATTAGTSTFTATVQDGTGATATRDLQLAMAAGPAGITLVQSASAQASGVGSVAVAFPAPARAGDLIVAVVRASTTTQTITLSDTAGSTWVEAVAQGQTADGHQLHIYYATDPVSGPNTVRGTFSGTNNHPWIAIYELAGVRAGNALDQTAHAAGSNAAPSTGSTGKTTAANEFVVAAVGLPSSATVTVTAGAGWVLREQDGASGTSRAASATMIAVAPGALAGTFSLSGAANWSAVVATFAPAPPA